MEDRAVSIPLMLSIKARLGAKWHSNVTENMEMASF